MPSSITPRTTTTMDSDSDSFPNYPPSSASAGIINVLSSDESSTSSTAATAAGASAARKFMFEGEPTRDEGLAKIEMAVLLVIFTVTVIGNSIVILGIYFRPQKMSRMYYFILHLSLADLITAFFNVAAQFFMELTWPEFLGDDFLCKFIKFTQILGPYSSSYVLVMTAFDRYQAICYPLSSYRWTTQKSKIMLTIAWLIALLFCIPQIFIFSIKETYENVHDCYATFQEEWGAKLYVTWYSISFFIIPLLLLTFAYTCICRTLWLNLSMKNLVGKVEYNNKNNRMSTDSTSSEEALAKPIKTKPKKNLLTKKNVQKYNFKSNGFLHGAQSKAMLPVECCSRIASNGRIRTHIASSSNTSPSSSIHRDYSRINSIKNNLHQTSSLSSSLPYYTNGLEDGMVQRNNIDNEIDQILAAEDSTSTHTTPLMSSKYGNNNKAKLLVTESKNLLNHDVKLYAEEIEFDGHSVATNADSGKSPGRSSHHEDVTIKVATVFNQPRAHSTTGISRAKIKTIKLTVTVICCYIVCSSPFIAAQLWACYDPHASESPFYTGTTFTILVLLASLNSCVNPWIFLFFNPNLLEDFLGGITRRKSHDLHRQKFKSSAVTMRTHTGSRRVQTSPLSEPHFPHNTSKFTIET